MKNINITKIVDPTSLQPFTGNSLKFLQDGTAEETAAIVKAFILNAVGSYSLTVPYVISGCVYSGTTPNFAVTAGEIFYGGRFYELDAVSGYTNIPQFKLDKTNDPTADPLVFSDNQTWSVHDIFKFIGEDTATAKVFDATDLVSAYGSGKISFDVKTATQNTNSTTYIDLTSMTYTTPNDGVTRTFLIIANSCFNYSTSAGNGGFLQVWDGSAELAVSSNYGSIVAINIDRADLPLSCSYVGSISPNTTIKLRVKMSSSVSSNFINNSLTIVEI